MDRISRLIRLGVWVLVIWLPAVATAQSREEVLARLQESTDSYRAVFATYELSHEPDEEIISKPGQPSLLSWGPRFYSWARQGEQFFLDGQDPKAPPDWPTTLSFDGEQGYLLMYARTESPRLVIWNQSGKRYRNAITLEPLLGLTLKDTDLTLPEIVARPDSRFAQEVLEDGTACVRIDASGVPTRAATTMQVTAWLDPAKGMLPRRLLTAFEADATRAAGPQFDWRTQEFMQVDGPLRGGTAWFPKRWTWRALDSTFTVEVTSAQLYTSLPAERFRPKAPVGTYIQNDLTGRSSVVGGPDDENLTRRINETAKAAVAELPKGPPGPVADATPQRGLSIAHYGFGASGLCLAVALAALAWRRFNPG